MPKIFVRPLQGAGERLKSLIRWFDKDSAWALVALGIALLAYTAAVIGHKRSLPMEDGVTARRSAAATQSAEQNSGGESQ